MRLLDTNTLLFKEFVNVNKAPKYAILSHTWVDGEEVSFYEMTADRPRAELKPGYAKIQKTCQVARDKGLGYAWIDTCCIDKSSSAELTESINSMFAWYERAAVCYVYLCDLEPGVAFENGIADCRWLTRGWTLQELIAPRFVEFYDKVWSHRGSKADFDTVLFRQTGIPENILDRSRTLSSYRIAQRMAWASSRHTTRVEDGAYCLLGIFGVNMPLIYGEGARAFRRLQEEIIKESNDLTIFAWNPREDDRVGRFSSLFAPCAAVFCIQPPPTQAGPFPSRWREIEFAPTNRGLRVNAPLLRPWDRSTGDGRDLPAWVRRRYLLPVGLDIGYQSYVWAVCLEKIGQPDLFARYGEPWPVELEYFDGDNSTVIGKSVFYILLGVYHRHDRLRRPPDISFPSRSWLEVVGTWPEQLWDPRCNAFFSSDMSSISSNIRAVLYVGHVSDFQVRFTVIWRLSEQYDGHVSIANLTGRQDVERSLFMFPHQALSSHDINRIPELSDFATQMDVTLGTSVLRFHVHAALTPKTTRYNVEMRVETLVGDLKVPPD